MNLENSQEEIRDPKLIAESYAEQLMDSDLYRDLEVFKLIDTPDCLQFQIIEIPSNDLNQRIGLDEEYMTSFLKELVDKLEVTQPQFLWRNAFSLEKMAGAVSIRIDFSQLTSTD